MIRIDARGLDPPEPFERVVEALAKLPSGEEVLLILDREPIPLYRFLVNNQYRYHADRFSDGRVEVRIWEVPSSTPPGAG
jgi:uncharacterized protein (DUF2249 family)